MKSQKLRGKGCPGPATLNAAKKLSEIQTKRLLTLRNSNEQSVEAATISAEGQGRRFTGRRTCTSKGNKTAGCQDNNS